MARHTLARTLHDVGLATWFGGSLMGAVGLNGAAASLRNPDERSASATVGWTRWAPVSAAAIGAHLIGAVQLLRTEAPRVRSQEGVMRSSIIKTALTAGALGTTAYSGVLNRKIVAAGNVPVQGATEPGASTPADVAATQKQLKAVQWLIPAFTGGIVAATSWQGEQMRPEEVAAGTLTRVTSPVTQNKLPAAGAAAALGLVLAARSRRSKRSSSSSSSSDTPVYPVTGPSYSTPVPASGTHVASGPGTGASSTGSTAPSSTGSTGSSSTGSSSTGSTGSTKPGSAL